MIRIHHRQKSLPEIRKSEARTFEIYWTRVGGIFTDPNELTKELFSDEFRKGDAPRPVGEGKYAIVKHQNHAEFAYILEIPKEPRIPRIRYRKRSKLYCVSYQPRRPSTTTTSSVTAESLPSTEEPPKYPEQVSY
jgi:hypothetical protein